MKCSRRSIRRKAHAAPNIKFEQQQLTSFAGLVLWQQFLAAIDFTASLARCFRHVRVGKVYGRATVFLQLIVHLLLGYRDLVSNEEALRRTVAWLVANPPEPGDFTEQLLGEFHRLRDRYPERVHFAGNGELMRAAHASGALAGIPEK